MSDAEWIDGFNEELSPETLFSPEIRHCSSTLYGILRYLILHNGFQYVPLQSAFRIYNGLTNYFLGDEYDKIYALPIMDNLRYYTSCPSNQGSVAVSEEADSFRNNNYVERKLSHNLWERFRKKEHFTGELSRGFDGYCHNYETSIEDYVPTEQQILRFRVDRVDLGNTCKGCI